MKQTIKILLLSLSLFLIIDTARAQVPQLFNYQGIARDAKGNPLSNQKMSLKLSVLPTADATVAEYEETQMVNTNEFGLYTLQIGNGTALTGNMKTVKWETGNKYIKVAIDPAGGTNYADAGTNQLLSVPYAIYADKAGVSANAGNDKTRSGTVSTSAAGTGTVNYLTKFTGANTIYNSQIFDNGTNIGIGTVSPSAKFQISNTVAGVQEHIRMQNLSATGAGRFTIYNNGINSYATFTKYGSTFAGGYAGIAAMYPYANLLAFGNNGVVADDGLGRFLISSGGNIGISIVKGATSKLKFHADYTTENVGIGGNAAPVNRVHLNNSDGTDMTVGVTNNTSGHTAADGLVIRENGNAASIINMENSTLSFGTNNASNITISSGGYVGVGATLPLYKLDVEHGGATGIRSHSTGTFSVIDIDANNGDAALRYQKAGVGQWNLRNRPADDYFEFFELGGGGSRVVIQDGTGNVGIGETTSPSYKLDVLHGGATGIRSRSSGTFSVIDIDAANGDAALRYQKAGVNQWNVRNNPSTDAYQIFELGGGGERMRIDNTTGKVWVNEDFTCLGVKAFTMDHPLDPQNKMLVHAAAESNEVINFYSGNVTTDATGKVTVSLPDYFEAINKDFRYQLTVIGSFAQAIISKEVSNNKFEIATNQPNIKVSWEVKGVRNDARMIKNPFVAVHEKTAEQKGKYVDPAAYDQPESKRISYSDVGESSLDDVKPSVKSTKVLPVTGGSLD